MMVRANWVLQVEADHDLLTLNRHLLDEGQDAHILSELPYTVKIIPPVRIDPQVNVGQGAKIGPHVYLERGASVGHDVILKDCIVLNKANVPSQKSLTSTILTTRGPLPT
jgi:NDP-sugar pyrophosphorylase family protein